jgi:hypothetical protein
MTPKQLTRALSANVRDGVLRKKGRGKTATFEVTPLGIASVAALQLKHAAGKAKSGHFNEALELAEGALPILREAIAARQAERAAR